MSEEVAAGDLAYWQRRALEAEAKAQILTAQVGGWAAQCAAQVEAAEIYLDATAASPHDSTQTGARRALATVIETDASRLLLERLQSAQADAAAYRRALEVVAHFWQNDPLAFGDEATPTSLAGRFADIGRLCVNTLELRGAGGRAQSRRGGAAIRGPADLSSDDTIELIQEMLAAHAAGGVRAWSAMSTEARAAARLRVLHDALLYFYEGLPIEVREALAACDEAGHA